MIEQTKFIYFSLGKAFEKQTKTIEDQGRKQARTLQSLNTDQQVKSIEDLFPKNLSNTEAKGDIHTIKMTEQQIIGDDLIYKTGSKKR